MKNFICFLFILVAYSGQFTLSVEKSWQNHLLDDCGCDKYRALAIEKVIDYYENKSWVIFWHEGYPWLEAYDEI
jgi:hypothetical protein